MKRQTCSVCLKSTTDYTTKTYNQRTPAEIAAGREPILRRFHTCAACAAPFTTRLS